MLRLIAAISLTLPLALAATAGAQQPLGGVAQVQPTRDEDCAEHSRQWYARVQQVEAAQRACYLRDGGTVSPRGVWMPQCGTRQQAYVSCAPIGDQLCAVRQQMATSVRACYRALAGHQRAARDRETAAASLEQKFDTLRRTMDQFSQARQTLDELHEKGIAATVIDRTLATPASAAEQLQSRLREAARTAGTVAPDASPELNRAGRLLDELNARAPMHEVARAFSSHSQGAARARMGDALNQLDGALSQANGEFVAPRKADPSGDAANARSQLRGAMQGLTGPGASQASQAGGAMAGASDRLRRPPGEPTPAGHRSPDGRGSLDELDEEEETETLAQREARARANQMLLQSMQRLQRDINSNSPANRAAAQRGTDQPQQKVQRTGGCPPNYVRLSNGTCFTELVGPGRP